MEMSHKERLVLGVIVGSFLLLQGLCGGYLARRLKLNALLWFAISALPLVGVYALIMLQSQAVSMLKTTSDQEKAFEPTALSYRMGRFQLIAGMFLWLFVGGYLLSLLPLPKMVIEILWLAGGTVVIGRLYPRLPNCPNCRKNLGDLFGSYCPECLGALSPGNSSEEANCTSCGKNLRYSRRKRDRNFRICGCSHCGLLLDKSGLQ